MADTNDPPLPRSGPAHKHNRVSAARNDLMALACLLASACSVVVDTGDEQCTTDLDCQVRGLAFAEAQCLDNICQPDPTWACVQDLTTAPRQAAVSAPLSVRRFFDQTPIAGAQVSLYASVDFQLESPLASTETDEAGAARLDVPEGFDGFLLFEAEGQIEPSIVYPVMPLTEEEGFGLLFAGTPGSSANLVGLLGAVPQPGTGIGLVDIVDCTDGGAAGTTLVYEGETQGSTPFYAINGVASSSARQLDDSGQAGIVNARPGVLSVEARTGERTVSSASFLIREDHVTVVALRPGRVGRGFSQFAGGLPTP